MLPINESTVSSLLSVVDHGLVRGLGSPVPGQMCVEAAVCYSLGLPHGDDPLCVASSLRQFKIRINDANWSSNAARAKGLRRLAVAQLGTKFTLNEQEFTKRVVIMLVKTTLVDIIDGETLKNQCRSVETLKEAIEAALALRSRYEYAVAAAVYAVDAVTAAYVAYVADAAYAAVRAVVRAVVHVAAYAAAHAGNGDKVLSDFCERVVQILIDMKAPGCEFLYLTEKR